MKSHYWMMTLNPCMVPAAAATLATKGLSFEFKAGVGLIVEVNEGTSQKESLADVMKVFGVSIAQPYVVIRTVIE